MKPRVQCIISDCAAVATRRSMCENHYRLWRRNGVPACRPKVGVDHGDGTRTCSTCRERKPVAEYPSDPRLRTGVKAQCFGCGNERRRQRYARDPGRFLEQRKQQREANIDAARAGAKRRYEENKEAHLAWVALSVHRRRALLRDVPCDKGITVRALRARHGDLCCYCGVTMTFEPARGRAFIPVKATIEHVVPLSRGGGHTWANTALACWQCNVRKNSRAVEEWDACGATQAARPRATTDLHLAAQTA